MKRRGLYGAAVAWAMTPQWLLAQADYLARILGGAKPAELPVQQPSRFELIVNLHLARAYGVNIPQSLLLQATELIQ